LTSGTLYQSKLDELALRIRTKVTMKVGTMGGDNYQYLIDLPSIYTLIATQMGLTDAKALYKITEEVSGEDFILTYGIVAYNSVPLNSYITLNNNYFVDNKAQLEAPITEVYVQTDSSSPYYII
jgi:hypothetical protein